MTLKTLLAIHGRLQTEISGLEWFVDQLRYNDNTTTVEGVRHAIGVLAGSMLRTNTALDALLLRAVADCVAVDPDSMFTV